MIYRTAIETPKGPQSYIFDNREELDKFLDENPGTIISTYQKKENEP